jgi:hypothetical protein
MRACLLGADGLSVSNQHASPRALARAVGITGSCCRRSRSVGFLCAPNWHERAIAPACMQAGGVVTSPNDTRRAIQSFASGLPLPAPAAGGACDPSVLSSVRYGYNTISTCSYSLTAIELENFCV